MKDIFTSKDSFIWISLFKKFTESGLEDSKFAEFLRAFKEGLNTKEVNGKTFEVIDKDRSTKDKSVISDKLNILETLMNEFLHIRKADFIKEELEKEVILAFVKENIKPDVTEEDIEFYEDMLNDWKVEVDNKSPLLSGANHLSMIGIVAYAIEKEIDLAEWMTHFFEHNHTYAVNQKKNYLSMKSDLDKFIKNQNKKSTERRKQD